MGFVSNSSSASYIVVYDGRASFEEVIAIRNRSESLPYSFRIDNLNDLDKYLEYEGWEEGDWYFYDQCISWLRSGYKLFIIDVVSDDSREIGMIIYYEGFRNLALSKKIVKIEYAT